MARICFTDKTTSTPITIDALDVIVRQQFAPPAAGDASKDDGHYADWFDLIGFSLALGETFDDLRTRYTNNANKATLVPEVRELWLKLVEIVDFLDSRFVPVVTG